MIDRPNKFNKVEWHAYITQKYGDKSISATVLNEERVKLEKKYGERIVLGKLDDMTTDEEKMDKLEYEAIGSVLGEVSPDYKKADDMVKNAYKREKLIKDIFNKSKRLFYPILGILLILALIKYLFS